MVGLLVVFLLVVFYIDCSSIVFLLFKDVKCIGLVWVVMEFCVGFLLLVCLLVVFFGIWILVGLGRIVGLNDIIFRRFNYGRNEEKSG